MRFSNTLPPDQEGFAEFNQHFRFIRNLGAGGFGKVVLAEDLKTGKEVAVKVSLLPGNNVMFLSSA